VKGMVAVGLSISIIIGGGYAYNIHNKLEVATKTVNRLEQKVERQDAGIRLLQKDKILLQKDKILINDKYNKSQAENIKLIEDNKILQSDNDKLVEEINDLQKNYINVKASAYIATCSEGCTGRTASGENVKDSVYYDGMRVIATDTSVIPMYSVVELSLRDGTKMKCIALDTGGGIDGHEIDLLVDSTAEALKFGKQDVTIHVLTWG
jgi:3D (Asp-Asp-Asp) domain-containing protein